VRLPGWSLRRTAAGLELWDTGGIWARAALRLDDEWLAAAEARGAVLVVYGVQVGVRAPAHLSTYTGADRNAELQASRQAGIVAAATIAWPAIGPAAAPGFLSRMLRRRSRSLG
jgi:hypothetical protein